MGRLAPYLGSTLLLVAFVWAKWASFNYYLFFGPWPDLGDGSGAKRGSSPTHLLERPTRRCNTGRVGRSPGC
jgi:hypothetical protein